MLFLLAYIIKGKVVDNQGNPIIAVAVSLRKDGKILSGTYTNEQGNFKLEVPDTLSGNVLLVLEHIAYRNRTISLHLDAGDKDVGVITMEPSEFLAEEVEVVAKPPEITYERGKKVVRVDEGLANTSGNAVDILRNVPGVDVDHEGNVRIRNSTNFKLYIDGKPTIVEPEIILRQIPASMIERIEIITNPSARYEAEGYAIVNIVLRKQRRQGYNYGINLKAGTYENYGVNANYFRNLGSLNVNASFSLNRFTRKSNVHTIKNLDTLNLEGTGEGSMGHAPLAITTSLKYRNFSLDAQIGTWEFSYLWDTYYKASYEFLSYTKFYKGGYRYMLHSGYSFSFLDVGLQYSGRTISENTLSYNVVLPSDTSLYMTKLGDGIEHMLRANLDAKWNAFEFGYLFEGRNFSTQTSYDANTYSNRISNAYTSYTNALYITYFHRIGNLETEAGIRYENFSRNLRSNLQDYPYTTQQLFPSLNLSYELGRFQKLFLSMTRRISHPRSWQLEPNYTYLDQYTLFRGNPELEPEYVLSVEAGYEFPGINLTAYFRREDNLRERIFAYDTLLYMTFSNVGYSEALGLESRLFIPLSRIAIFSISLEAYRYDVYSTQRRSDLSYNVSSFANISLGKLSFQTIFVYRGKRVTSQGIRQPMYWLDVGIRYNFSRYSYISLNLSDVFGTMSFGYESYGDSFAQIIKYQAKWPYVSLTFSISTESKRRRPMRNVEDEMEGLF